MAKEQHPTEEFTNYHLDQSHDGLTIAAALRALLPSCSWNDIKVTISARRVQVNGNLCLDEARRVTRKDVIKLWRRPLPKPIEPRDIRFLHVDSHLLVIEKPAGVTSVRHFEERTLSKRRRQIQPTLEELVPKALADYLIAQSRKNPPTRDLQRIRNSNPKNQAPKYLPTIFPVHRLDRETSGLMLFARSPQSELALGRMFRKHLIDRRYHAVVHGPIEPQKIESMLIRDIGDGRRGSTQDVSNPDAQLAITHVRPLESIGTYTIVECRLETGRTHQIRIHLAEQGHRLCGESLYNRDTEGRVLPDESHAPRHALHSASLQLKHPITGESLAFESSWPKDLKIWLQLLRAEASRT